MSRLRSDFWVSAYIRRCNVEGVEAVLRKRGAAEAGAVFVKVDRLDGTASLYGPAPQLFLDDSGERLFSVVLVDATPLDVEERMQREQKFDPDLWLVEVDDRAGRHFLDLAPES
ncbi:DUF1491 family protein [Microvirga brassicacearum]|uniref:DUF1491 family protein n=1 Tax=Microvirga brassicacearum TaxID=2580413 RepID=A0A5N3P6D0_9HYPH|nr:DUF1491 family protein [Microvirga brassicacearum]KAB0265263.1 DUF1491 family protein [Microvirga brassicacearum]